MKILICDDHIIFRNGVTMALEPMPAIRQVLQADNGQQALHLISQHDIDVALLDINLPGMSGIKVLEEIKKISPKTRVVMLTQYDEREYGMIAMKNGASGFLKKDHNPDKVLDAITTVMNGGFYISKWLTAQLADHVANNRVSLPHEDLSPRELDVMLLLVNGQDLKEIAINLHISYSSVCTYQGRIFDKMGFKNIAELIKYCISSGLI